MEPFDLHGIQTYDLQSRASKVFINDLGTPVSSDTTIEEWLKTLPKQLAAKDLLRVKDHIQRANAEEKLVAVAIGGHVIKTGCGPYLVDWIERGIIQSISMNGAAAIHDFELACAGKTSEDVGAQLKIGQFGMARETADAFAIAARDGAIYDRGLGAALGRYIEESVLPYRNISVVATAWRHRIPCTIHVALGTDIVHMHPHVSGAAMGEASMIDFRILCRVVSKLNGGVWLNLGSAVIMPEVFLKAVAVVKNFGYNLDDLVCVNFDKEAKYRTQMNVLSRPTNEGIQIIGHHELLIPLLSAVLKPGIANVGTMPLASAA
jgi:hypothetical protein